MARGFVDVQNNGWMGTDFNDDALTVERVLEITRDLRDRGTVGYLPTIVTGDPAVYEKCFGVVVDAMGDGELGGHILGIHLEGPFISPEPGAVGAHPKQWVTDPSVDAFKQFQEWADGNIRILTLAPERPGAMELIRYAADSGVVVSMGHHLAENDVMRAALDAGASLHTHVGNGIPNMIHRHQNPLWLTLARDDLSGLFITDGHHLPPELITVALRAKGTDRFIVISDASPLAGMPVGDYEIFGGLPVTIDETGLIYSKESQSLAGSHAVMLECMNHLASLDLLSEDELWKVGFENPVRLVGRDPAEFETLDGPDVRFENGRFTAE